MHPVHLGQIRSSSIRSGSQRRGVRTLHVLLGQNYDSGRKVKPPKALSCLKVEQIDYSLLYDLLTEARVFKVRHVQISPDSAALQGPRPVTGVLIVCADTP